MYCLKKKGLHDTHQTEAVRNRKKMETILNYKRRLRLRVYFQLHDK